MMIHFDDLWPRHNIRPYGVLHCGSSSGQERDVYVNHNVKEVVWIEAIPSVFAELLENVKDIPGTTCINVCVSDVDDKEVEFNISNNEAQSSSYLNLKHHAIIHPTVSYIDKIKLKTKRVDTLLKDFKFEGKWLLNCDLQGAEMDCFVGMGDLLDRFDWIYTEVNKKETYENCPLIEDIDAYLSKYEFVRVETGEWVADCWTDALYSKKQNGVIGHDPYRFKP